MGLEVEQIKKKSFRMESVMAHAAWRRIVRALWEVRIVDCVVVLQYHIKSLYPAIF